MSPALAKPTEVAVGLIFNATGQVLFAQRPVGKPYEGWWEFPGGKIEAGESVQAALTRELQEELGLTVRSCQPWITRHFVYPHATVCLHFCKVQAFDGQPQSLENQAFIWDDPAKPSVGPILPAALPMLRWLTLPKRLSALTASADINAQTLSLTPWLLLNTADLPAAQTEAFLATLDQWRSRMPQSVLLSDSASLNRLAHTDGLYLTESELKSAQNRPDFLSKDAWFCAEVTSRAMLSHAANIGCDFALIPYQSLDQSNTEQQAYWSRFSQMAHQSAIPVYAKTVPGAGVLEKALNRGGQGVAG